MNHVIQSHRLLEPGKARGGGIQRPPLPEMLARTHVRHLEFSTLKITI